VAGLVNHSMRRDYILEGVVEGTARPAWCGRVFVATSRGGGRTDISGAPDCPDCISLIEKAKAHAAARERLESLRDELDRLTGTADLRTLADLGRIRERVTA